LFRRIHAVSGLVRGSPSLPLKNPAFLTTTTNLLLMSRAMLLLVCCLFSPLGGTLTRDLELLLRPIRAWSASWTRPEPSFFVVALCFVLMLCALCSVLMLCAYRVFWSPLAKHKACARSRWPVLQKADAPAHKNWVFLSRTGKHKAQSMSTKQPILTKICDFEHKARSTKH
jgi:hypothetical protein